MYFRYPDRTKGEAQGVGAYHTARVQAPVPTAGFGQTPAGYAPIISPYFAQAKPWPYILGPNYTRPVFKEYSRQGNFVPYPIVRMPALNGLGQDATPKTVCEAVQAMPEVHARCLAFNTATGSKATQMQAQIQAADEACSADQDFASWANCYYGHLSPKWYENPVYLGGAVIGASAVVGVAILALRRAM